MRLLVTGATGFVGRRLVPAARARWADAEIVAVGGPGEDGGVDIADAEAVRAVVAAVRPSHVAHLAGLAAVSDATREPARAFAVNLQGSLNLVEAIRRAAPDAVLLHVSSAEVYGRSLVEAGGAPVGERALLQPVNAYAASKAAADLLVQAAAAQGLCATIARPFNHIGAGQSESFAVPAFAAQIARAEAGLQPPVVRTGRLADARDFLTVEDVVAAYLALLDRGWSLARGVFNVASGVSWPMGEILARLLALAHVPLQVETDPARLRREPTATYVGDASRLRAEAGWEPRGDINVALAQVLEEQRARTRHGAPR